MNPEDLEAKFRGNARLALSEAWADRLIHRITGLGAAPGLLSGLAP